MKAIATASFASICIVLGCRDGTTPRDGAGALSLQAVDSVTLLETDSLFLGRPVALARDAEGAFYVADNFNTRIVKYDSAGQPVLTYGSEGPGPGELQQLRGMLLTRDGVIGVDTRARVLKLFDTKTAALRRTKRYDGIPAAFMASGGDSAWLGIRSEARGTTAALWDLRADTLLYLVPSPKEYALYPNVTRFSGLPVVSWSDTVLVGFGPLNGLFLLNTRTGNLDTIIVPARSRRGTSRAAVRSSGGSWAKLMNSMSALVAMHRLRSGHVALVHYDNHVPSDQVPQITSTLYLSLLSPDLKAGCLDNRLPATGDAQPVLHFRGDTIFVLYQTVSENSASSRIKWFHIDLRGCSWSELPSGGELLP